MVGRNAKSLELPEDAISDSYRDFFTINDVTCYGESKVIDNYLYYYAAEQPYIYKNTLLYSGIAALAGFLFLSGLIGYLMFGYRKWFESWSEVGEELIERKENERRTEDNSDHEVDPRNRWELSLSKFGIRTPMHNAFMTLEFLLVSLIIGIGVWYYFKGADISGSLIGFIMHGQWSKGLNLFSFTSILILFAQVVVVVSILKLLLRVVTSPMGLKGETFRRLGLNLLTYAGMIFFVYMALYNVGVNIGALIASLSLPAFALSLGAKDLITDVLAGVSIVFDGEFKVGDFVEIGGFSGEVLEIGVRTTKVLGAGENIKIIANRDIKNVINLSRRVSLYILKVKISTTNINVKAVEKMLAEELPKLHEKIPGLVAGPYYWGICEKGFNFVTMTFGIKCQQRDYYQVKDAVNMVIPDLLDEKGIPNRF
jgi:small conductance mechanosensitive channel